MIAKFNTPPMASSGGSQASGDNSTKLMYLAVAVVGAYLLYRFVIKPEMDKKTIVYENTDDASFE